eukprot:Nk52_evm4s914 gene=Nk52_evmTU4s914
MSVIQRLQWCVLGGRRGLLMTHSLISTPTSVWSRAGRVLSSYPRAFSARAGGDKVRQVPWGLGGGGMQQQCCSSFLPRRVGGLPGSSRCKGEYRYFERRTGGSGQKQGEQRLLGSGGEGGGGYSWWRKGPLGWMRGNRFGGAMVVVGGVTVYYAWHLERVEETGRLRVMVVGQDTENHEADVAVDMILRQYSGRLLPASHPWYTLVQKVATRLVSTNNLFHEPRTGEPIPWRVFIIDDPQCNAFVLPNGKIFVFTGLLRLIYGGTRNANLSSVNGLLGGAGGQEDMLAAVLGHEIAHKILRHGGEKMSISTFLSLFYLIAGAIIGFDAYRLGSVFGHLLLDLPFSRRCETEADYVGLRYMATACYDPAQAVVLWERMGQKGGGAPPEYLSTHPSSSKRIDNIQEWLPEMQTIRNQKCPSPSSSSWFS